MNTERRYWKSYNRLQKGKHELLKTYLGGWFPILSKHSGRIIYVDSHAGRGRHKTGDIGFPLVALNTLLNHNLKDKILDKCEVIFLFLELKRENFDSLKNEIKSMGTLPNNICVEIVGADFEQELKKMLGYLENKGFELAPSFFFIDPFGFVIPMDLMKRILNEPKSELLITFMVRYIDMAINNPSQEDNLDVTFGNYKWKELRNINDPSERHQKMLDLYIKNLGCDHNSILQMRGKRNEPKYSLVHATNHPKGRKLMKDSMWSVTPDGTFRIFQNENPNQLALITIEPDLRPLKNELIKCFYGNSIHYKRLEEWLLPLPWRDTHLKKVIRDLRKTSDVAAKDYEGRFAFNKNPLLTFKN